MHVSFNLRVLFLSAVLFSSLSDCQLLNTLLEFVLEHAGECLERFLYTFALHCRALEEFKADRVCEAAPILGVNSRALVQVALVSDHDALELAAQILLLDAVVPLAEQVEAVGVGYVVYKHDLVGFAQQVKSNLLEDVLARNVNQVQFH